MYNENLDCIDFDATGDLPSNRGLSSFLTAMAYRIIKENKAGISVEYGEWGFISGTYLTSYLFDFENRKVIRSDPVPFTQLYDALAKAAYPEISFNNSDLYARSMFWDIRSRGIPRYAYFPWVYPVQNPDLFQEAVGLKKWGNTAAPEKKEQGSFSFNTYYYFSFLPSYPVFFFSYDRGTFTQDCTKSEYFGTELHKAFTDVLWKTTVSASSFLTEGAVEYRAENMRGFSGSPWAVKGADMAEAEVRIEADRPISWLVFGNGFYRAARPDLYTKNSRPKEIVITYGDTSAAEGVRENREHHVILADTFEMQLVPLLYEGRQVTVKIVSVYPGTDYDDICLNYIGALGNPLLIDPRKWYK
jgi:hypothetical protein